MKKVLSSMSLEPGLGELEELLAQEGQATQAAGGLSVWQFLELFNSGRCLRGVGQDTLSMAIHEVYQELIQDVLKQVGRAGSRGRTPRGGGARKLLTWLWPAGLPVEAGTPAEELGRALVPAAAQLPVLLRERGVQGEEGDDPAGRPLLRGGEGAGAAGRGRRGRGGARAGRGRGG